MENLVYTDMMTGNTRGGPMRLTVILGLVGLALAGNATLAQQGSARRIGVEGQVVDAACFMMHPQAASIPSHQDCAEACLNRGVPVAIMNEAGKQLYFPADGNKQLVQHLGRRVKASGAATRKNEPLALKMAVGEKNEMAVTVTGGYNVLAIESVSLASKK